MSLTVALSKGKLLAGAEALFRRAGLPFPDDPGRRLVVDLDGLRFLFVKDMDVPDLRRVRRGRLRHRRPRRAARDGQRRLRAARPRLRPLPPRGGAAARGGRRAALVRRLRVATKYPRVATAHFLERGVSVEVVRLAGSVELAPGLGLSDCIVDVVETGRTLEENGLEQVEEVAASSARLIVNRASYHARRDEVAAARRHAAERRGREDPPLRHARPGGATSRSLPRADASAAGGAARAVARIVREVRARGRRRARALDRALRRRAPRRRAGSACSRRRSARLAAARRPPRCVARWPRMAARIEAYHRRQLARGFRLRLGPTARVLEEVVTPLASAGLYVPGGAGAYPSSVLMNAIPARVAGVPRSRIVTPPRALEANPAVAAALVVAGVEDARLSAWAARRPSPRSPSARATVPGGGQDRRPRQRLRRRGQAAGARPGGDRPATRGRARS